MNKSHSEQHIIAHLNKFREPFLDDLGCTIVGVDAQAQSCEMTFDISQRYCHSGDIIQGGFVAAMLDAVTTHAIFASNENISGVSTLELKVSYLEASRRGKLTAIGRIEKMSRSIAFVSGELTNSEGLVTAKISSTAKIRLQRTD